MAILVAAGGALLGPTLGISANLGWIIGSVIGTLLFPPQGPTTEGPRLGDLTVTASTYGQAISISYGTLRMAGNMIWSTGIEEVKNKQKVGGKGGLGGGGATQITYEYFSTFAIAFCEGPADDVLRMWCDGKLILDKTGTDDEITKVDLKFRFYPGTEDQEPDSLMEDDKGVGAAPAHRGLCYIVFERLPLKDFGNRIPNITAEIALAAGSLRPFADANLFTEGEGGLATTFLSDGALFDRTREVIFTSQSSVTIGQNVLRRLNARTLNEDRQRAYTVDALDNDVQFLTVHGITPEGFVVALTDSGNTSPISVIHPDTLNITATFGVSNAGTDNDENGFEALGEGKTSWVEVQGQDSVRYYALTGSVFNSAGLLEVTGGSCDYVWDSDTAPGQGTPRVDDFARVIGTCAGARGLGFGEGYVLAGPNTASSPSSGSMALFKVTVNDGARYDSITGTHLGVEIGAVAQLTPASFSSDEDDGTGAFFGSQLFRVVGPVYDETDDTVMVQFANADNDEFFMAKIDPSDGAVLWVSAVPAIRNEIVGFNHSRIRYSHYGQMDGTSGWILRTSDGVVTSNVTGFSREYDTTDFGYWDDALSAFVGGSSAGISKWFLGRGEGTRVADMEEVVLDLCSRAGLDPSTEVDASDLAGIEIPGYVLGRQSSVRDAIQPLANLAFFDGVESDYVMKFLLRDGKSVAAAVPQRDLAPLGNGGEYFREQRVQEVELPLRFSLTYMDADNDYQQAVHNAKRIQNPAATMSAGSEQGAQLPMALTAAQAKQAAEKALYSAWVERASYELRLPWTYLALDPADVVTVSLDSGLTLRARLAQLDVGVDLSLATTAIGEHAAQYTSTVAAAKGESGLVNTFLGSALTRAVLLCCPLLRDRDDTGRTTSVLYAFMGGYGQPGWRAGTLFQSADATEYDPVGSVVDEMTWGSAANALGDVADPFVTDEENELTVYLNTGELSSTTQLAMVNGANAAALIPVDGSDPEVFQFRDAAQNADGSYTLSGLLRGRRGTDVFTGGHAQGDVFVLLEESSGVKVPLAISEKDQSRQYKAVTTGTLFEEAPVASKASPLNDLKPYAVVHHAASIDGSDDITLTWTRRTRVGGGLQDGVGTVPVSEDAEEYEVDVLDGPDGAVVHTETGLTSPTFEYTSTEQTNDGFSPPLSQITVRVYQISAQVGRGFTKEVTLDVE